MTVCRSVDPGGVTGAVSKIMGSPGGAVVRVRRAPVRSLELRTGSLAVVCRGNPGEARMEGWWDLRRPESRSGAGVEIVHQGLEGCKIASSC
ncbi:hypothetical protein GCM10010430_04420 [Kitasatospora cystarginea]|uniref:Uncharacterized protein n=1 Tax=Kitasatospora cystarginea TaxID=58350 RepID=A0ABP5Q7F2_9ACTN